MKLLSKFACMICLFGLLATCEPWASAQQTPPAQSGSATTGAPAPASDAASKPANDAAPPATNDTTSKPANVAAPKPANDTTFRGVKVTDAKGKQTDAQLIFSDSNSKMVVRVADRDFVSVPYDRLDKFSYEYTKKHRVTQGAIVMVASLGAGAIVMLTKSKSHWLYVDFHEQEAPKSVVLRMDKNAYKTIMEAVKTHTGKEVQVLQDAGKPKKEKNGDKQSGSPAE